MSVFVDADFVVVVEIFEDYVECSPHCFFWEIVKEFCFFVFAAVFFYEFFGHYDGFEPRASCYNFPNVEFHFLFHIISL